MKYLDGRSEIELTVGTKVASELGEWMKLVSVSGDAKAPRARIEVAVRDQAAEPPQDLPLNADWLPPLQRASLDVELEVAFRDGEQVAYIPW